MSTPNPRYSRDDFRKMLELEIQDVKYFLEKAEIYLAEGNLHGAYRNLKVIKLSRFIHPQALKNTCEQYLNLTDSTHDSTNPTNQGE